MPMSEIGSGRYDGEWWLPENPNARVPGTLVVDYDGGSELHLIGALWLRIAGAESRESPPTVP